MTSWKLGLVRAQWGHIVGPRGLSGVVAPHSCSGGFDSEGSFGILQNVGGGFEMGQTKRHHGSWG